MESLIRRCYVLIKELSLGLGSLCLLLSFKKPFWFPSLYASSQSFDTCFQDVEIDFENPELYLNILNHDIEMLKRRKDCKMLS